MYCLAHFMEEKLPWSDCSVAQVKRLKVKLFGYNIFMSVCYQIERNRNVILLWQAEMSIEEIAQGCPSPFKRALDYSCRMKYDELPDYELLHHLLDECSAVASSFRERSNTCSRPCNTKRALLAPQNTFSLCEPPEDMCLTRMSMPAKRGKTKRIIGPMGDVSEAELENTIAGVELSPGYTKTIDHSVGANPCLITDCSAINGIQLEYETSLARPIGCETIAHCDGNANES
jgi:hypothetical protein